ncbi:unnamed protein product, partial [marine sediment metagenome]
MQRRAQHDRQLASGDLNALIVAFPCDSFGWPSELPFNTHQNVDLKI